MPKYKAVVQYLGTRYFGWQQQKDRPTVQGRLKAACLQVTAQDGGWVGAGRTDTGVHALGQCAHLRLETDWPAKRLLRAFNGVLPWDIRVRSLQRVPAGFHAQKLAFKKRYEYRIYDGPVLSPFLSDRVYFTPRRLDLPPMREAAELLIGTHDFSGFAASGTAVKTRVRTVFLSSIRRRGHHLTYRIEADGFLQHMVRNVVGTLVEIGRNRRAAPDVLRILASRDRRNAGPTAQPQGLYLSRVWYRKP